MRQVLEVKDHTIRIIVPVVVLFKGTTLQADMEVKLLLGEAEIASVTFGTFATRAQMAKN